MNTVVIYCDSRETRQEVWEDAEFAPDKLEPNPAIQYLILQHLNDLDGGEPTKSISLISNRTRVLRERWGANCAILYFSGVKLDVVSLGLRDIESLVHCFSDGTDDIEVIFARRVTRLARHWSRGAPDWRLLYAEGWLRDARELAAAMLLVNAAASHAFISGLPADHPFSSICLVEAEAEEYVTPHIQRTAEEIGRAIAVGKKISEVSPLCRGFLDQTVNSLLQ